MFQRQAQLQEQRQILAPQLIQRIEILGLPVVDLREKIGLEIEKNPALEAPEEPALLSVQQYEMQPGGNYLKPNSPGSAGTELRLASGGRGGDSLSDAKHKFLEGAISRPETLQEHLLWQLALETDDGDIRRIGELLIQNLDADGFHREPVGTLLRGENPAKTTRAIRLVQSLDPPGTCTADYRESLKVQARLLPDVPGCMEAALDRLPALKKGKFAETAKKLGRSEEEIRLCFERIKNELYPFPGRQFDSGETRYVVPDVEIAREEGEFTVRLNGEVIPVLGINPFFMKVKDSLKHGERDFVQENIKEARWFIDAITRRNHTLLRVSRAIVEFQRAFFDRGPKYLAPLTLHDIAGELGIHETTVSRTANGKYMLTEWGIYELRYFFTNSISGAGSNGSHVSKEGAKELIKEIISGEERRLSDQELAGALAKRGVSLARRTVSKYRNELDLGTSYTR